MTAGFLVVDKPGGITSTNVVTRVKRATGIKKVGHAGTLDPMATGMVVVAIGPVTRLIRYIQDQSKEYFATAEFGVSTDTLDAEGAVLSREAMDITSADLEQIKSRFIGTIHQVPPMVSALKHDGRRLHELAREGVVIEREARPVTIHELDILSVGTGPYPEVFFRVLCGKGTYVRSLADDMAAALGGSAHLTALRRTRTGSLSVDGDGVGVDELDRWKDHLLSASAALRDMPKVVVDADIEKAVRSGVRFVAGEMSDIPPDVAVRVEDRTGGLIAIYRRTGEMVRSEVVIPS